MYICACVCLREDRKIPFENFRKVTLKTENARVNRQAGICSSVCKTIIYKDKKAAVVTKEHICPYV